MQLGLRVARLLPKACMSTAAYNMHFLRLSLCQLSLSSSLSICPKDMQPVREAVSYRILFTAGWFGMREKQCSRLEIYDRLRASEQAD